MAGSPMKRRMLVELEKRAKEAGEAEDGTPLTAIDVVCEWIAEGKTQSELARDLTDSVGQDISAGVISAWIVSDRERKAKVEAARLLAAHIHAEESVALFDELNGTEVTREEIALASARSTARQWLASKWNRPSYGNDQAQVNVQVNLPGMHLDALRRRAIQAKTQPLLPQSEGADYETVSDDES